jgi:hypothetical protein
MSTATMLRADTWERVQRSMDSVEDRLIRITDILNKSQIPYAVVGGNAVAAHIVQVKPQATVMPTKDVDIMIRRSDLTKLISVANEAGFYHARSMGIDMLRDGVDAGARDSVHLIFENEKVKPHEPVANPSVDDSVMHPNGYRVLSLQALVQIKLTAFRNHDKDHLEQLFKLKLIDASWAERYIPQLAERLLEISRIPDVANYTEDFEPTGS